MLRGASASDRPVVANLGFYPGYASVNGLQSLESWLGRDSRYIVQFADQHLPKFTGSIWGQVVAAGALQTLSGRTTLVESIPLAFGSNVNASTAAGQATVRANLLATIDGAYDSNYRACGALLE